MVDSGKQLLDSLARIQTIVEHSHHSIQEQSKQVLLKFSYLIYNFYEILKSLKRFIKAFTKDLQEII